MNCLSSKTPGATPRVCDRLGHAGGGHGIFPELSQAPGVKIPRLEHSGSGGPERPSLATGSDACHAPAAGTLRAHCGRRSGGGFLTPAGAAGARHGRASTSTVSHDPIAIFFA